MHGSNWIDVLQYCKYNRISEFTTVGIFTLIYSDYKDIVSKNKVKKMCDIGGNDPLQNYWLCFDTWVGSGCSDDRITKNNKKIMMVL